MKIKDKKLKIWRPFKINDSKFSTPSIMKMTNVWHPRVAFSAYLNKYDKDLNKHQPFYKDSFKKMLC